MRDKLGKIPAPFAGLGLGFAGLGSVTGLFMPTAGLLFSSLACIVLFLFSLKIIFNFKAFSNDLKHPVFSSIIPTFTMGLMIVSNFISKGNFVVGKYIWLSAIVLHFIFFINFLAVIIKGKSFQNIVPSYFIPPVGIVVACISGKMFNLPTLCATIFYFGFFSYMITLILVLTRLYKGELPKPKQPTLAIMAAPASLCLAGLLTISKTPNLIILYILAPLSVIMTLFVYFRMFKLLKIPFNPGYSAYTFPLVISAVGTLKLAGFLGKSANSWSPYVKQFGLIELYIAVAIVVYVGFRYLHFYLIPTKS